MYIYILATAENLGQHFSKHIPEKEDHKNESEGHDSDKSPKTEIIQVQKELGVRP